MEIVGRYFSLVWNVILWGEEFFVVGRVLSMGLVVYFVIIEEIFLVC